jgi:uncharacterized protein (DUF305 family)
VSECMWRLGIVLILTIAAATPKLQEGIHAQTTHADAEQAWPEMMATMEKMHVVLASIESSGNSDADFVRLMLPHHQAAIDMAKTQLLYGTDPQMRRLAQEVITDQQSEIELMQLWLKQRGSGSQKPNQISSPDLNKER